MKPWSGVRERLEALERAPNAALVFGVTGHAFALGPHLDESELCAVEEPLGCRLPDSYRTFLQEVGDVRAGPAYGLLPIRLLADPQKRAVARLPELGNLAAPFPHAAAWNDLPAWITEPAETPEQQARYNAWEDSYFDGRWIDGALPICDLGCGHHALLIVTGPTAGAVWVDARPSDAGLAPEAATFYIWYLSWLTSAETTAHQPEQPATPGGVSYVVVDPASGTTRPVPYP